MAAAVSSRKAAASESGDNSGTTDCADADASEAPATVAPVVTVEEKLAAASLRREENLGRRAEVSRRNKERGEEVRRRKEEKRKKEEEWKLTLESNKDERLKETRDLFDELDL